MRLFAALLVVITACGPAVGDQLATTTVRPDATTPITGGAETEDTTSTKSDGTSTTLSDRSLAPDFSLQLGDGGEYRLSESGMPVYLIFWAEW